MYESFSRNILQLNIKLCFYLNKVVLSKTNTEQSEVKCCFVGTVFYTNTSVIHEYFIVENCICIVQTYWASIAAMKNISLKKIG